MQTTDITGKPLPLLNVSGYSVYPPNLKTVKAASELTEIITACLNQTVTEASLSRFYVILREILNNNAEGKDFTLKELTKQPFGDAVKVVIAYAEMLSMLKEAHPVPQIHSKEEEDYTFDLSLTWDKLVADFANISITAVQSLNYVDYLILRREALIHSLSKTAEGREMLEDAYCFEQTEPDRASLRSWFNGTK